MESISEDLPSKLSIKAPIFVARKENVNVVFIGHVDSGKSTTAGHILCLTGMVDKRTLEKLERESRELGRDSWLYAFALDTDDDEKQKGITVSVGKAYFETDKRRFTILDAPGHKNYVPSMISGAAQADAAILIISARRGEFETGFERGGQTREHAVLVKTLGIKKLIVAVNKMDDPTVAWSQQRYDEIVGKLMPFLKNSGFQRSEVEFIPISGFTGQNLKDPVSKEICPWLFAQPEASSQSLLGYLDSMPLGERNVSGPLLLPVGEKYRDNGTVVGGKIECGQVTRGQQVLIMPGRKLVEVASISYEETELPSAFCGDNIKLKLRGIEEEDVFTGNVVCDPARPVYCGTRFRVQMAVLNCKNILSAGFKAILHVHMASEEVTIASFLSFVDRKTGQALSKKPFAREGDLVEAILETACPVCIEEFASHPQLGRFSMRDEGKTVAMGKVLEVLKQSK